MAWQSVPTFGDEYAEVSQREHSSGAQLVEVRYGARDAQGNPARPEDVARDGHGCWQALGIGGVYQMLSWRHPVYEGGNVELGKGRSADPLHDLEEDLAAKERICARAEAIAQSQDWKATSAEIRDLFDEWKRIANWHTPKEDELWERFKHAKDTFYERREAKWETSKAAKEVLVAEARSLVDSTDWKATGDRFSELLDEWRAAGFAGRDTDDLLWAEFNDARQTFYDRRSEHFREMDGQREQNRLAKQALIAEAREVVQSDEWKATGDALQELFGRWKEVGSAGRDYDEDLWADFNGIRQDFFERRHQYYDERDREFQAKAERKAAIVQEAAAIAARCDYSSEVADRMRELDREWKDVGFAGRDNEDRLWAAFQEAKDSFWSGKRAYAEQRQREWRERTVEAIERKRGQVSDLREQIADLEDKMADMRNQEYVNNMFRWIDEKQARIHELEAAIADMERRLK